ncbi:MAG: hypothetical protein L0154_07165 [Chloroflexi bacterium]|nr:hypothetical protein [Chloroflexota bacterium]
MFRLLLTIIFLTTGLLPAQETPEPRLSLVRSFGGPTTASVMSGDEMIIVEGTALVRVALADMSQPLARIEHGYGRILDLAATESALYALTPSHVLVLTIDGTIVQQALPGGGSSLSIQGNHLIVAALQQGIRLMAIKPDGTLRPENQLPTERESFDAVVLENGELAIADGEGGVSFRRLDGERSGQLRGIVPATEIAASGSTIFAANRHYIQAIDAQTQRVTGVYAPLNRFRDVEWRGEMMVIADGVDGLKVYSSDRRYLNGQRDKPASNVTFHDGFLYATTGDSMRVYDWRLLPDLPVINEVALWSPPTATAVMPSKNLLLVALGAGGLAVIDIASPFNPILKAALPFSGPVEDVLPDANNPALVYLALGDGRLVTLNFMADNPDASTVISDIELAGQPTRLALDQSTQTLAVASGRGGVHYFRLVGGRPALIMTQPSQGGVGFSAVMSTASGNWLALDGDRLLHVRLAGELTILDEQIVEPGGILVPLAGGVIWGRNQQFALYTAFTNAIERAFTYTAPTTYHDLAVLDGTVYAAGDNGITLLSVTGPQEILTINTPQPVHDLYLTGETMLTVNNTTGVTRYENMTAQDRYRPLHSERDLLMLPSGKWGTVGKYWGDFDLSGDITTTELMALDGVALPDGSVILLDDEFHPYRLAPDGTVMNRNEAITGADLALDGETLWLVRHDGMLYRLNLQTLLVESMQPLNIPANSIAAAGGRVYIGTLDGTLLEVDGASLYELPGTVNDIRVSGEFLLVSTAESLLWLDRDLNILASFATPSNAADLAPNRQWLAVANGVCGVRILDARQRDLGLRDYAVLEVGHTTDVQWLDDRRLLAMTDGTPALIRFNPDGHAPIPPIPSNPAPATQHPISGTVNTLRWSGSPDNCQGITYEVSIDGQVVGSTQQPFWPLNRPLDRDIEWQVTAINSYGEMTAGLVWAAYGRQEGWASAPLAFSGRLQTTPSPETFPWWIIGIFAAVMAGLGLIALSRRLVSE